MRTELDMRLCEKYPKIFADRGADMRSTAMCWGFECGDGWYWLIDQLCGLLQGRIDANPHLNIPQPIAVQIKEKFGGLRFYVTTADEQTYGMIDFAEHLSNSICEECGTTIDVGRTNGWIMTICKPCFDKSEPPISHRTWKSNYE